MVALFCHNNDVADGWEREGEDIEYFQKYSTRVSYPFGINIVTYAMTHEPAVEKSQPLRGCVH